jgi:flagellum-specific ATP synthase
MERSMESAALGDLKRKVAELSFTSSLGRVTSLDGHSIQVSGLQTEVRLGDRLKLTRQDGSCLIGEVLRIAPDAVTMLPDEPPHQVALFDRVISIGPTCISPCDAWIGRIIDPYGAPLDHKSIPLGDRISIQNTPPSPVLRKPFGPRLETGFHLFNTLLPIVRGQRVGIFAGSGVGKSTLLADLVGQLEADVVVLALVGERGREIRDFTQNALGVAGMKRTIVVAATADTAATTRLHCAQTAMRVAEFFRDQGRHVLLFVDSMTRFAEAHREAAISAGEFPSLQGFPASTPPAVTRLVERAGPGILDAGDITAIFSVLVAKSDMDEPIADMLRGVLDGHIVLDRSLAERGQFPAVDVLKSVSRALPQAATEMENKVLSIARSLLSVYEDSSALVTAGLYADGSDPNLDQAIKFHKAYQSFAVGMKSQSIRSSFESLALCVRRANGSA